MTSCGSQLLIFRPNLMCGWMVKHMLSYFSWIIAFDWTNICIIKKDIGTFRECCFSVSGIVFCLKASKPVTLTCDCMCVLLCVCVCVSCLVHALTRPVPAAECRDGIRGVGKHVAHHVQTHKDLLRSDVSWTCHRKLQEKDWQIQTTSSHSDNYLQSRPEGQTLGDGMTEIYTKLYWNSLTGV